jgi:hypothetical protein
MTTLRYVEYDDDGFIFHIAEVDVADPVGTVHPALLGVTDKKVIAEHERRLAEHREFGRSLLLASLIDSHNTYRAAGESRGIHVLADGAPTPTHDGHRFDVTKGKIRAATAAEKKAYDAAVAESVAAAEAAEGERVKAAIAEVLAEQGVIPEPGA